LSCEKVLKRGVDVCRLTLAGRQSFLLAALRAGAEEKREHDEKKSRATRKQFQQRKPRGGESRNRTPGLFNHNSCVAADPQRGNSFFDVFQRPPLKNGTTRLPLRVFSLLEAVASCDQPCSNSSPRQFLLKIRNLLDLHRKPAVDLCQFEN